MTRMIGAQVWQHHAEPYGKHDWRVWPRRVKRREERQWRAEADEGVREHELWNYLHDPDWPHWIEYFEQDPELFELRGWLSEEWLRVSDSNGDSGR